MRLFGSIAISLAAARNIRDADFKPDTDHVDAVCKEKGPGAYPYSPTICEYYINCGEPGHIHHVMPCPAGTMFNEDLGWCDYAANVPPPCGQKGDGKPDAAECSKGDGFYPNQLDCGEYFVCRDGQPMDMQCPESFSFDQLGKICTVNAFVSSFYCTPEKMVYGNPVTTQAMAFCAEKEDGYYANPGVCQTFIKCWQKMGSEFACPDNLIWDDRFKICEHPAIVQDEKCMKFAEDSPKLDASELCDANGKEGLYPVPGKCANFVQCYNHDGKLVGTEKTCPDKLYFNPDIQVCDWPENLKNSDCHNGKAPFDPKEEIEVPNDEVNEIAQDASKFCTTVKAEGTFRDPQECGVFYTCQSGGRADKFHCPSGTVYNDTKGFCDYADNLDSNDKCYHVNLYTLYPKPVEPVEH